VVDKGYTCPKIDNDAEHSYFKAEMLRHPIIEHITTKSKYIPNDVALGDTTNSATSSSSSVCGILLFGVNAVGKSSLMKSIGINIIMAQAGMYVASSKFTYKPYKYLFTRIRNNDNLYAGLSSFEVEMKEFKVILKYANQDSIILGDELCSGTETQDATALVASGIGLLSKRKSSFIFATHLHFLADMNYVKDLANIRLCHMAVELDPTNPKKLVYSRKIHEGSGPKSYGIMVCESMDLDDEFIEKAKEIRANMQQIHHNQNNQNNNLHILHNEISVSSKYNTNKVIGMCEVCNNTVASDVHHINQQCDANHNNLIESSEYGIFNKNKLWNLVALCKECHQLVHSSPAKLEITGYVNTSDGLELVYNVPRIKEQVQYQEIQLDQEQDQEIEQDQEQEIQQVKEDPQIIKNQKIKKNKNSIISPLVNPLVNPLVKQIIIDMKNTNNTPKKIQYDLKRYHKIDMTQQQIRDFM
jgi:DNA mismatch repair protein MutS